MKNFKKSILIFLILTVIFGLIFVVGFLNFYKIKDLKAQVSSNVWGWAWNGWSSGSGNGGIGWLSFSRDNTNATVNYGVNINDASGELSGHAWANPKDETVGVSNIGWLSFNKSETGLPPAPPFDDDNQNYIAKLDLDPNSPTYNKLLGWARFLGLKNEDSGWVRFTGPQTLYNYYYTYDSATFSKPNYSKCSCDVSTNKDCANQFQASASDPQYCYDEESYSDTVYALYPSSTTNLIGYKFSYVNYTSGWQTPRAFCDLSQTDPDKGTILGFTSGLDCDDDAPFYLATTTNRFYDQGYLVVLLMSVKISTYYDKTNQGKFTYNRTSTSTSNSGYQKASCDTNNLTINCPLSFQRIDETYDQSTGLPLNSYYDQYQQTVYKYHIFKKNSSVSSGYEVSRNNKCELIGYAWSQDFGWIKFNGDNYKVVTSVCPPVPPTASDLRVLTNSQENYCDFPLQPTFNWQFNDSNPNDNQSAYQLQIATDNGFSNIIYDTGKIISNSNTYRVSAPPNGLNYNSTYYWRVKVWDRTELASDWAVSSFTTLGEAPRIDFSWQYQGKTDSGFNVKFFNNSYMPSGTSTASWLWNFQDGNPDSSSSFEPTPWITFNSSGEKNVKLTGADQNGISCSKEKKVFIEFPAPRWKEIMPNILQ